MSFAEYLNQWMNHNSLFESKKKVASAPVKDDDTENKEEPSELSTLFTIVKEKIGGDINDSLARTTSFEAIRQTLDGIEQDQISTIKNSNELAGLIKQMTESSKIPFLQAYLKNLRSNLNKISSEKKQFKHGEDFKKFYNLKSRESLAINRIYKLYTIFNYLDSQPETDLETATLVSIREKDNKLRKRGEENTFKIKSIGSIDEGTESNKFEIEYEDGTVSD